VWEVLKRWVGDVETGHGVKKNFVGSGKKNLPPHLSKRGVSKKKERDKIDSQRRDL